jgi:hypothetical protein
MPAPLAAYKIAAVSRSEVGGIMKQKMWILVLASAGAVSALSSFYLIKRVVARNRKWVPFEVVMVERQYRVGAEAPVRTENYLFARRSDGSSVKSIPMQIMPHGGWANQRIIEDFAAHLRTSIDPSTESLTTYRYSRQVVAKLSTPTSVCSDDPQAAHVQVLGYDTVVATHTAPGPGAGIEVKQWRALQLNCFALQEEAGSPDDKWATTREALLVKEGPPPASLFEIPAGYVERAPSEVMAERARRFPDEPAAHVERQAANFQTLDNVYRAREQQK